MVKNQTAPGLNRSLSLNLYWLRSANHVKFTCVMYREKQVLVKIIFTNWLNMGLPLQTQIKKTIDGVETLTLQ